MDQALGVKCMFSLFYCKWYCWVHSPVPQFTLLYTDTHTRFTHWGRDKLATIFQTTFLNAFFTEVCSQWSNHNIPALVLIMARRRPGDKPLSEPMVVGLLTHICATRPQWVKPHIWTIEWVVNVTIDVESSYDLGINKDTLVLILVMSWV